MNLVVFEDGGAENLFPITIGRACYEITVGSCQLIEWVRAQPGSRVGLIRPYLEATQWLKYPELHRELDAGEDWTLVVNARISPQRGNYQQLEQIRKEASAAGAGDVIVAREGWALAAALVPTRLLLPATSSNELLNAIEAACHGTETKVRHWPSSLPLLEYPHDVIRDNLDHFPSNLEWRLQQGGYEETRPGLFCRGEVAIHEWVVVDSRKGPVVVEEGASIGPFTVLNGPVYIGKNCRIIEHSAIKDCVSLGATTKIGGEVEASVIESYTNKQHHGFLGHSYLGSWINLGAGTCNSDLKNTYGKVNMEYRGQRVPTDMRFIGCVIGDYSKTAINTGIFTGKTIGACSMVYGFVTTNVPSFVNYARSFGQTTELPPAVMQSTQARMFARRNVEQRPCDLQLIEAMYQVTATERQMSEEPLVL